MQLLIFKTAATVTDLNMPIITATPVISEKDGIILRNQSFSDIEDTRDTLMRAEGWAGMLHAWPALFALDPAGFYMLERNEAKLASISMVTYPNIKLAYVGMYVVPKELRGQGFGRLIFEKVLEHTENTRGAVSIGLNCFSAMSPLYFKYKFQTHTVDSIWKLTGHFTTATKDTQYMNGISESIFNELANYDTCVFGDSRTKYLRGMINKPNTVTVLAKNHDQVLGYGIISQRDPAQPETNNSYRIGPLYASNQSIADEILQKLIETVNLTDVQSVFIESPGSNQEATEILTRYGFKQAASLDKMYRGDPPKFAENQIFGYSSLAFGG